MFVYPYSWLNLCMECNTKVDIEDSSLFSLALRQTNGWCNTAMYVSDFNPLDKLLYNLRQNMINID